MLLVAIPSNWGLLSYGVKRRNFWGSSVSQSLLIEVFFPTERQVQDIACRLMSQSLLIEVFFPTLTIGGILIAVVKVAIPSNWGLLSYCSTKSWPCPEILVAIPSNWGLLSYKLTVGGLHIATVKSQSLLIEVFFPTNGRYVRRRRQFHVAIPSNWGLLSYLIRLLDFLMSISRNPF